MPRRGAGGHRGGMTSTDPTSGSHPYDHSSTGSPQAGPALSATAARAGIDRFYDAVRAWGATRGADRWAAGVCAALGRRLGLDPLVVRAAFLLLTLLGGIGLLLYGLGWALLPDATGRIEAEAARHGDVSAALVAAGALVLLDLVLGNGLLGLGWAW